ncbi:MAG: lantibiotic immunity ABC transporter MutG family permease subunit [Oscillospiraceae bacterium]
MGLYANLKSDLYKIIHTPLWLIHLIIPTIGAGLFIWYYSVSLWDEAEKISAYIQTLSITFPILIGIITAMTAEFEQGAGDFQLLLSTPDSKSISHLSKLMLLVILGFLSSLIALAGFGIGFIKMGYTTFNIVFYIKAACLLSCSVLPLYLLQYIVSFIFGKGFSLGLGILGGLLSALLLTGLGDSIWWMLPWGIASRLSGILLMSGLSNFEIFHYGEFIRGILFLLLFSMIFTAFFLLVFRKWEGRKSGD